MLDRVSSGFGGPEYALRAVSVSCDLSTEAMRVGRDGLKFRLGKLGSLRIVALGKHAASGTDLDEVGAILDVLTHLSLDGFHAIGNSTLGGVILPRKQIVVAMSAGDAEKRAANEHAGTGNVAVVD